MHDKLFVTLLNPTLQEKNLEYERARLAKIKVNKKVEAAILSQKVCFSLSTSLLFDEV